MIDNSNKPKESKSIQESHQRTGATTKKKELEQGSKSRPSSKERQEEDEDDTARNELKEIQLPNHSNVVKGNI
ncbi:MAG TPA: hypothetical protein VIP70_09315 [Nitrososphaeraceae archaeon]